VLHHLTLWVPDLSRSEPPWRWLLEEMGYVLDPSMDRVQVYRHRGSGFALALEQSPDMVPGMLYSRLRPGVNHIAFRVESWAFEGIVAKAADHGWSLLPADGHPIAGGARVAYLEDVEGFEVELIAGDD
jgi:catechol 2,3-dioxygenase-like lactoylglutathione lyase family enzyme